MSRSFLPPSLAALYRRASAWLITLWRIDDPVSRAWYTRAIYLDYIFNSAVGLFISLAIYVSWPGQAWPFLQAFMVVWTVYLSARLCAGVVYARRSSMPVDAMVRWARLPILFQAIDGIMLSLLCLNIYPRLDVVTQMALMASILVMVGSTAFSLAGHWLAMAVYAPPIYMSLAWITWQQDHDYAKAFALFTLAMFGLYLFYASNQRRTMNKGFELATLNGQLADQLQAKNAELQDLATGRGRLLATVSHDLRQPAHAIGLMTEQALNDPACAGFKDTLRDLHGLSQSLSASLATLMDLTRLDAGLVQARIAPTPLEPVLARLRVEYGPSARSKGLALTVASSSAWVQTDAVLLHAILGNLVANALKYTRQGQVQVRVEGSGAQLRLVVQDTGMGIAADQLDRVFREFVRLDGSLPGTEGLGLGLSIVRRYAALLSHQVEVQSEPEQGSRFSVVLERAEPDGRTQTLAPLALSADARLQGLRVLVVDNVDLLLKSMERTLSSWGCLVSTAECLTQARDRQQDRPVDLIISDFHLGDREPDGLAVIEALRARHGQARWLPAILLTGDVAPELEATAGQAGVHVLHKPVRPAVMQRCMLEVLERGRALS
ncbi:MAG: hybrid sensor histidine kinase/response regulator [Betaproteobacteria bacterium]